MVSSHYDVLGVDPHATDAEIKRAYRALAQLTHPDRGGKGNEFNAVHMAYATLIDPAKRAEHDEDLRLQAEGRQRYLQAQQAWANEERRKEQQRRRQAEESARAQAVARYRKELSDLEDRYRRYHFDWQVPLQRVIAWRQSDRFPLGFFILVVVLVLLFAVATIMSIYFPAALPAWAAAAAPWALPLLFWSTVLFVATPVVWSVRTLVLYPWIRRRHRRTAVDEDELMWEYVAATMAQH